ncbi:ras association domain-containing protein 5 isoform X1 [Periophthalmus magnuspinnatus]|uniref:ras association domain-containing protein 5 isoform X1 n=1 Tax=Periophthalmus magnuspinnatus TaxID=409849 RepID=UPI00243663AB|nr:ras association domain-containing protein 5 isoform X1 [Periophthalmus magnuspinnatus]
MVFRRSSVGDSGAKSQPAGVNGGVMPCEGCRTPDRLEESARRIGSGGVHDLQNAKSVEVVTNGHTTTNTNNNTTRGACRKPSPDKVSVNGHGDDAGSCMPLLERLTQGKTGVVKLARTETHRRQAWAIFPSPPRGTVGDPRVKTERGEGHRFEAKAVRQDWCDACNCQVKTQALKCRNCSYTCHLECESQVQLDCNQRDKKHERTPPPRILCSTPSQPKAETKEEEEGGTKDLSQEEVRQRIEEYNSHVSETGMKLSPDGSYSGFIKVHLRLSRPVTVQDRPAPDGQTANQNARLCSDGNTESSPCPGTEKRTSFYLPCDCVKQLHISSLHTTREVIQGLLKMLTVLDNPCKFALYRQTHRDGQDLFQKLALWERPLLLRLIAGPDTETLSFVLKENETGEVEWHAFSVPELQNFLGILEKEESERVRVVEQKYAVYRKKLQEALQRHEAH